MASLLKTFRKLSKGEQDTFEIALNLSSAFEELHVGEVRLAEGYSLTDVMYSVQIMDPKMDTGLTMPRDPQKLDTADKLNQRSLTNEELIGLIDGFFTQSMMWLDGAPLSSTLFSYFHVTYASSLDNEFIKSWIAILTHIIHHMRLICIETRIFEPDDLDINVFDFDLNGSLTPESVKNHIFKLNTSLQKMKQTLDRDRIALRIKLLESFCETVISVYSKAYTSAKTYSEQGIHCVNHVLDMGLPETDLSFLFDQELHRRSFVHGPPRTLKQISVKEGYVKLQSLLMHLKQIMDLKPCLFDVLLIHLDVLTKERLNVFSRSVMNAFLMNGKEIYVPFDDRKSWLKASFEAINKCPVFHSSVSEAIAAKNRFEERIEECFDNTILIFSLNWCSIRRKLGKLVLYYDQLQLEFEGLETALNASGVDSHYTISSWIYHIKLRLIDSWLDRGFDLELYSADEVVYKYIEQVKGNRSQHLLGMLKSKNREMEGECAFYGHELAFLYSEYYYGSVMNVMQEKRNWATEKLRFIMFSKISSPRIPLEMDEHDKDGSEMDESIEEFTVNETNGPEISENNGSEISENNGSEISEKMQKLKVNENLEINENRHKIETSPPLSRDNLERIDSNLKKITLNKNWPLSSWQNTIVKHKRIALGLRLHRSKERAT